MTIDPFGKFLAAEQARRPHHLPFGVHPARLDGVVASGDLTGR